MTMEGLSTAFVILSLFAAFAYGAVYTVRPIGFVRSMSKTLAVAALALSAFFAGSPLLLVGALALGATGDYFLSREGDSAFLSGLGAFAAAHVLYILLLVNLGGFTSVGEPLVIGLLVLAIGMAIALFLKAGDLKIPVVIYVAIIATMGMAAFGLPETRNVALVAALLFIISDTVLAFELFLLQEKSAARRVTPYVIWVTYFAAQFLFFWDLGGLSTS